MRRGAQRVHLGAREGLVVLAEGGGAEREGEAVVEVATRGLGDVRALEAGARAVTGGGARRAQQQSHLGLELGAARTGVAQRLVERGPRARDEGDGRLTVR